VLLYVCAAIGALVVGVALLALGVLWWLGEPPPVDFTA